jgi:NAD(P)-dependent dehydrogenase (short-subunit alcohol dehydrogenase family)
VSEEKSLRGGVAVITGGGSGLGAAMAARFAAEGMAIALLDIDGGQAKATAAALLEPGAKVIGRQCDVSDRSALQSAAAAIEAELGACTVLCANVGVQQFGAIGSLREEEWRWVLDVNVMGVINTVDVFLPQLRKGSGRRHVVVTSSNAYYSPGVRMAAYTTSKYAVTGYAETLRMELAEEGVGVSILFPAGMSTTHLQSSVKARPAKLGEGKVDRADIEAMMQSRGVDSASQVATAEHATRHLLAGLDTNARYIVTHGECRDVIVRDHAELLAAHDRGIAH